jgi:hypothetical protein
MKNIHTVRVISLFAALFAGACALVPPRAPDDLKFESLSIIDLRDTPEPVRHDIAQFDDHPRRVMKVSFSSKYDLISFAQHTDTVGYDALACREWENHQKYNMRVKETGSTLNAGPTTNLMNASLYIYSGEIPIGNDQKMMELESASLKNQKGERVVYQAYLDVPYRGRLAPEITQSARDDLQRYPEDICLQMGGGRMWTGAESASNIVIIPRDDIAAALKTQK